MIPRIPLAAAAALALALTLVSCAQTPEPVETETAAPPAPVETEVPVVDEPTTTPEPEAEPTCETIITPGYVSSLADLGWSAKESEFRIGELVVEDGIYCSWANWEEASDHGQFFAWGELTTDQAAAAQSALLSQGWVRENEDGAVYFTEPAESAFQTDENGYGMTYLFGDGWVRFADTKQSLLLITWT
ncbi:hypothetical protein [Microbacterium sp. CIAB417]|uniref:hypothetical protein n=1 Tax=Microbacterium sp. CIAB417 TaxID=2860287 RepID=UPI001FAE1EEC|nr:hypothetical protein [Microbacterium sp. CIAB417]